MKYVVLVISGIIILTIGAGLLIKLFLKSLPEYLVVGFALILFAYWVATLILKAKSAYRRRQSELAAVREEVEKFILGERNDAIELAQDLPKRKRRQLSTELKSFIISRLPQSDLNDKDTVYYLRELHKIDSDEAQRVFEQIHERIIDEINDKVRAGDASTEILKFIRKKISKDKPATALYSDYLGEDNDFYHNVSAAARPSVHKLTDVIRSGKSATVSMRFCALTLSHAKYSRLIPVTLTATGAVIEGISIPLANFIRFNKNSFCPGAMMYIYLEPYKIKQIYACEPAHSLIIELIQELRDRLPIAEREPDNSVMTAIRNKHSVQETGFKDLAKIFAQNESLI